MQLSRQHIQIVEKVIENENGLFLARFQIIEAAGNIRWKLIEVTEITAPVAEHDEVLLIAAPIIGETYEIIESRPEKIVSPYSSLLFFISQPTRAPNL